jgi:hypothetical protein
MAASAQTGPRGEGTKRNNSLRDFRGVNTQAARQVIGDNEFAWLENVHPVGFGNMPVIPAPSASLATWAGTAYHIRSVNIANVDYELILTTAGALYAVNLTTFAVTTLGINGTFSGAGTEICQWRNERAIIVDPTNGYFSWDGATLTKWNGQVQALTITNIGAGYTTAPALGFSGGGGSGASATAAIQVGLVDLNAAGTGYAVGELLTIAGGTFTTPATLRVSAVNSGTGAIEGINIVALGAYTAAPTNPAASTAPYGSGATFDLNFGVGPVTVTNAGSGYTSAPAVAVTGGGGTGGTVTANLFVVPSGGTGVATYAGRVWVSSGRTIVFSAPDSFNDFTPAAGGGSFIVVDETLHSTITALRSANNFLYVIGSSSINVIADVNVVNGQTVFSNTNLSASIGTNEKYSIFSYYRALWFATNYGIYALYGSTTQKASDALDGIWPLITNATQITSGTALLSNINVLCFAFKYEEPGEASRTLLAVFEGKKWFFASQGDDIVHIDTAIIDGTPTLFGTDGTKLFRLFSDADAFVKQTIVTKLWDMGDPLANKQALKIGLEVLNPLAPQIITGTLDTELVEGSVPFTFAGNVVSWINNSSVIVPWQNNSLSAVEWISSGYAFFMQDIQTTGRYIGVTFNGLSARTTYSGAHLQYEIRTSWPQGGAQ